MSFCTKCGIEKPLSSGQCRCEQEDQVAPPPLPFHSVRHELTNPPAAKVRSRGLKGALVLLILCGTLVVLLLIAASITPKGTRAASDSRNTGQPRSLRTDEPPASLIPRPVVTMADYRRIDTGMSYRQVRAIIGADGEELSRSDIAQYTTIMYSWKNANGSNMNAMFQNGRLVTKAQFGLPEIDIDELLRRTTEK